MSRPASSRTARSLSALALVAAIAPAAVAQSPVFVRTTTNAVVHSDKLPVGDDVIASLLAQHFNDALHNAGQPVQITLVLDANNQYVSGRVAKATVITRADLDANGVYIDSTHVAGVAEAARIMAKRADGAAADGAGGMVVIARTTATTPSGTAVALTTSGAASDEAMTKAMGIVARASTAGVFGTEVDMNNVESVGIRKFDAGAMGDDIVMVTVVKLKN